MKGAIARCNAPGEEGYKYTLIILVVAIIIVIHFMVVMMAEFCGGS